LNIYHNILQSIENQKRLLAILIDPDKTKVEQLEQLCLKINQSPATHIFVGGSLVENVNINEFVSEIKKYCQLPILIFPGHPSQISDEADGLLFLSLLSGRNTDFLIEHHINSIDVLENSSLEIIPTAYILINGGKETAVQKISNTQPIDSSNIDLAYKTAKAGQYLGKKLIYLEAGSGALHHVPLKMIEKVSQNTNIPLMVGGGIKTFSAINDIYNAGANMIVIGTAFENDNQFFK
jgi:phosphoglycerol geranylgeranyltransferase